MYFYFTVLYFITSIRISWCCCCGCCSQPVGKNNNLSQNDTSVDKSNKKVIKMLKKRC